MTGLIKVRFIRNSPPYFQGDEAGWDRDTVERLKGLNLVEEIGPVVEEGAEPQKPTETAKTEPAKTEPAKTEPAKPAPAATEPAKPAAPQSGAPATT